MFGSRKKRRIFISYRRTDAGITNYIQNKLSQEFGARRVFMDIRKIRPGENFVQRIEQELKSCEAVVAIIGRDWFKRVSNSGGQDLNLLRAEVSAAFKSELNIIPVLVNGATMPLVEELPADLQELAYTQAVEIRESSIDYDINRLISALKGKDIDQIDNGVKPSFFKRFFLHFIFAFCGAILTAYFWHLRVGNLPQPQGIPGYALVLAPAFITALLLISTRAIRFTLALIMGVVIFVAEIVLFLI